MTSLDVIRCKGNKSSFRSLALRARSLTLRARTIALRAHSRATRSKARLVSKSMQGIKVVRAGSYHTRPENQANDFEKVYICQYTEYGGVKIASELSHYLFNCLFLFLFVCIFLPFCFDLVCFLSKQISKRRKYSGWITLFSKGD